MGKITKRTLALILTLCMVMSYMIPAVWAEGEAQDTGVLTYDFGGGEGLHLKAAEIVTPEGFILGGDSETTERSRYLTTSRPGAGGYWAAGRFAIKFQTKTGADDQANKQWYAIQIRGVKAGTYNMTFQIGKTGDGGLSKVHVLNLDQAGFLAKIPEASMAKILDAKTLSLAENEEIYAAVNDYVLNPDNEVIFDSNNSAAVPTEQNLGCVTFPRDGSYVLMIQAMGPSPEASISKYQASFAGLTMAPAVMSLQTDADSAPVIYNDGESAVAAINAAPEGAVATLIDNVTTENNVIIRSGVTLNLNGKTLTANQVIVIAGGKLEYNEGTLNAELYAFTAEEQAAADAVQAQIDAIGEVTLEDEAAINAAGAAYNALSDNQKKLVNVQTLDAAKQALEKLKADIAAAKAVQDQIDAISEVTLESEAEIKQIAAAYQALTSEQKALVDNSKLVDAQLRLAELKYPGTIIPDDSDEDYEALVGNGIAAMDPVSSVELRCATTGVVNGHDYLYMLFAGNIFMVYDIDTGEVIDKERNAFSTPRYLEVDEDGMVWAAGGGRMLYKYNPYTKEGKRYVFPEDQTYTLFPNISSFGSLGITSVPGSDLLYYGTANRAFLGAFNKKTEEFIRVSEVLTNAKGEEDCQNCGWGGIIVKDGYAYLGIDGNTNGDAIVTHEIVKYDLATNQIVDRLDISTIVGSANWLERLTLVDDVILGSIWRERVDTIAVDISGDKMELIDIEGLPKSFNGGISAERNGKVYFMGVHDRGLLEYDIATKTVTETGIAVGTPTGDNVGSLRCTGGTGSWVTVDHPDLPGESLVTFVNDYENNCANLVFYNLETKKTVVVEDITGGQGSGHALEDAALSTDGSQIYVGAYENNQLGIYDVESGKVTDLIPTYSHQIEGIIEYGDYVYAGVYASCSIVQVDKNTEQIRVLCELHTETAFYQHRVRANTAGDGKVFFATGSAKGWYGGDLIWYDVEQDRMYVAAGPNPEDVYYFEPGTMHQWHSVLTGEQVVFDNNGDGVEDKYDRFITVNGVDVPRFSGVIENQTIVSMTYQDGYIYGCSSKANGTATDINRYPGNAVLFVYDVENFQVVATYDLSNGIPGLATPVLAVDSVYADPDVPGKFWGVVSDTLFSFTFDHETELFDVAMELSLGRSEYKGVNLTGRGMIFDESFMYVPFGTKGTYMIERANPTNFYRLTDIVPLKLVMPNDGNIYFINSGTDLQVLYTAEMIENIKAADAVRAQIAAIGTVTLESEAAIKAVRTAYDALTAEQKALVKNAADLTAAEAKLAELKAAEKEAADKAAAAAVIAKIEAIGTVTLESEEAIKAARTAYDALTAEQKKLVDTAKLVAAEAKLAELKAAAEKEAADKAAAEAVTKQIEAIGTVTLESEEAIKAVRAAYEALTAEQKVLVDTTKLTAAEAKLAELKAEKEAAEKEAADKAAAEAVTKQIEAIGEVTLESEEAIKAARAAYEALTAEQKALVTNLNALTAAESALAALKIPQTGDVAPVALIAAILVLSAAALCAVLVSDKKKRV